MTMLSSGNMASRSRYVSPVVLSTVTSSGTGKRSERDIFDGQEENRPFSHIGATAPPRLRAGRGRMSDELSHVGEALRQARRDRGWSLRDVAAQSRGQFKPSVVGGYERGVRVISIERFIQLTRLYGVPPDRLLA